MYIELYIHTGIYIYKYNYLLPICFDNKIYKCMLLLLIIILLLWFLNHHYHYHIKNAITTLQVQALCSCLATTCQLSPVPISTSLVLPKTAIGRPSSANLGEQDSPESFPGFPQKNTHKTEKEVEFLREKTNFWDGEIGHFPHLIWKKINPSQSWAIVNLYKISCNLL